MSDPTIFQGLRFAIKEKKEGGHAWQYVDHPGAVVILPKLDASTLVLIQNKRHVVEQTLLELPAGTLELGEKPIECAKRELEEETGYTCQSITPLFECFSTPGFCNEKLFFFEATDLTFVGQKLDQTEQIEPYLVSLTEAIALIKTGQIIDMKTIAALAYLNL